MSIETFTATLVIIVVVIMIAWMAGLMAAVRLIRDRRSLLRATARHRIQSWSRRRPEPLQHPPFALVQYSDQQGCRFCSKLWDMNDPNPPPCEQWLDGTKWTKGAFYKDGMRAMVDPSRLQPLHAGGFVSKEYKPSITHGFTEGGVVSKEGYAKLVKDEVVVTIINNAEHDK